MLRPHFPPTVPSRLPMRCRYQHWLIEELETRTLFSIGTLPPAGSPGFPVTSNSDSLTFLTDTASKLAFHVQPASSVAGTTLNPVIVYVENPDGSLATASQSTVTIALTTVNATLAGTISVPVVQGVATFQDLSLAKSGTFTLLAADGALTAATSRPFTISPDLATSRLTFKQLPANSALVGKALSPSLIVQAVDQYGNPITSDHSEVLLSTNVGAFTGAPTKVLHNSSATFSNILFKTAGTYTLTAAVATNSTLAITTPISFDETITPATVSVPTPTLKTTGYTFGTPLAWSIKLSSNAPASIPFTGTPTFIIDGTDSFSATSLTASGTAKFALPTLSAGSYDCQIVYPGDLNHTSATSSSFTLSINPAATTTSLSASPHSLVFGQPLTLTATVKSGNAPAIARTGSMEFFDNGQALQTIALNGSSSASLTLTPASTGSHNYQAVYLGDANFTGSSSPKLDRPVNQDKSAVLLESSTASPILVNHTFNLTVQVSILAPGAGLLTGDLVAIQDNGKLLGTLTLDSGGSGALPGLSYTASGTHNLTALFAGDTDTLHAPSSVLKLVVERGFNPL